MMRSSSAIYWIDTPTPGRLAVGPRPRGGDWLADEIAAWQAAGIQVIASLLMPEEVEDLNLGDEAKILSAQGIRFLSLPIPDRDIPPSDGSAIEFARALLDQLMDGRDVLVHCRQGAGRSGMIAAAVLIAGGASVDYALHRISAARGVTVPETPAQERWLEHVAPILPAVSAPRH